MPNLESATKSYSNSKTSGDSVVSQDKKIVVSKNGPYVVSGNIPMSIQAITPNKEGFSWEWSKGIDFKAEPVYYLCRCGHSKNKPYCDGTHEKIHFEGKETATRQPSFSCLVKTK